MSPDPLPALIVKMIREGGKANELMRDHDQDSTGHCPLCRCLSPCSIYTHAARAWRLQSPRVKLVKNAKELT